MSRLCWVKCGPEGRRSPAENRLVGTQGNGADIIVTVDVGRTVAIREIGRFIAVIIRWNGIAAEIRSRQPEAAL